MSNTEVDKIDDAAPDQEVAGSEEPQDHETSFERKQRDLEDSAKEVANKDLHTRLEWAESNFRNNLDTDIDWLHRKAFLGAHVGEYSIPRLQALACCYANSIVMGCRYPMGVMAELQRVEEETIRAVEALLNTSGLKSQQHLRGSKRRDADDDDSNEHNKDSSSSDNQRPQWFGKLQETA